MLLFFNLIEGEKSQSLRGFRIAGPSYFGPLCTYCLIGFGSKCMLVLSCCLYLISLISWVARKMRVLFIVYSSFF